MSKNKYLVVHLLNDYSGSPLVLSNFINVLLIEGHEVELLTSGKDGFLSGCECKITQFPYHRCSNKVCTLINYLISQLYLFFFTLFKCLKLNGSQKPIVVVNTLLPFGVALAAKLINCRIIYYVHETSLQPALLKRWVKWVYVHTATIGIFVSSYLKQKEGENNKFKIHEYVVYNSLPNNTIVESRKPRVESGASRQFTIFMPCSLKAYKGVYDFVELASTPQLADIKFVLALNAEEEEFNLFMDKHIRVGNIEVHRRPANIGLLYQQADMVLNLSNPELWIETFGMTVIEAFSFGCPVIVPTVGGPAEIVQENIEGFKIPVAQKDDIIGKIRKLADNKVEYERHSDNALKSAGKYTFDFYCKNIKEVLWPE